MAIVRSDSSRLRGKIADLGLVLMISMLDLPGADKPSSSGEAQFLANTRQLIFEGKRSGEGYFSPDGKALIFQSEREPGNPFYQIYLLDLESGDSHRVSPGIGKTTCSFFRPGSDEVLFASTHLDPEAKARQKAELEFRAAGKQRRYSWDYDTHMDIFTAKRDGSQIRRLTTTPGYDGGAFFSPDGRHIVYRAWHPTDTALTSYRELLRQRLVRPNRMEIWVMNADGSDQHQITNLGGANFAPYYTPDGRRIIFSSNYKNPKSRDFELYLVNADGSGLEQVTHHTEFDGFPMFSPDGSKLIWASGRSSREGELNLFLADWRP